MSAADSGAGERADGAGDQAGGASLPPPLPAVLVTGWPAYPADTASALVLRAGLEFSWQREREGGWQTVGRGLSYTPGAEDLGHRLRLIGHRPGTGSEAPEICWESTPVCSGPGQCPAERGHKLTTERLGPEG